MKILVISDTHESEAGGWIPEGLLPHLKSAELVIHAGDLMEVEILEELKGYGSKVIAVQGNMDPLDSPLPETREFELEGVEFALIHDSGDKRGRPGRMRRRFPDARVVVFGHSHIPLMEDDGEQMLINPGSPTDKRRQPDYTFAVVNVADGKIEAEILKL